MNKITPLNWESFKNSLLKNPDKLLKFRYAEDAWVNTSYHITEIKQAPIISVDCGGKMNSWTEIIVQLWEPSEMETGRAMKVSKALSIIDLVEKSLPLNPLGTVKIEFGNSKFDTRQMYPAEFLSDEDAFSVILAADFTQCKALGRGQTCDGPERVKPAVRPKFNSWKLQYHPASPDQVVVNLIKTREYDNHTTVICSGLAKRP